MGGYRRTVIRRVLAPHLPGKAHKRRKVPYIDGIGKGKIVTMGRNHEDAEEAYSNSRYPLLYLSVHLLSHFSPSLVYTIFTLSGRESAL